MESHLLTKEKPAFLDTYKTLDILQVWPYRAVPINMYFPALHTCAHKHIIRNIRPSIISVIDLRVC
jgi:hypothetical protein